MFFPRQYYINNYGNLNQGKKIVNFIKTNIPNYKQKINLNLDNISYLKPKLV